MKAETVHVVQSVTIAALEYVLRKVFILSMKFLSLLRKGCIQKKIAEKETLVHTGGGGK